MVAPRPRPHLLAILCALVVAGLLIERVRALAASPATDFDDAYMFVRYANNLLRGYGLAWNPGEAQVQGVTGLLHVLVVAGLRACWPALDDAGLLRAASAGAGLLALGVMVATCARFARHPRLRGRPLVWAALLLPAVAYSDAFQFHLGSGMDTMLSTLANAVLVFATLRLVERATQGAAVVTALAGYAAFLARPDNGLHATLLPALAILLLCPRPRGRLLVVFGALIGGLLAVDSLVRWRVLGTVLPLAFHAKRPGAYAGFAGEYFWNPFLFLEVFAWAALPFLLLLLVLVNRARARLAIALLASVVLTFAWFFSMNQIMGHLARFYFPSLPLVVAAAALMLDEQVLSLRRPALRAVLAVLLILAGRQGLELAAGRYSAGQATQRLASLGGYQVDAKTPLPELDSWQASVELAELARRAPKGSILAMSEHGLVGARARDALILDLVGLHDPEVALHGFKVEALLGRRPDLIWMPHPDHTQMVRDLLDSDEFWRRYDLYPGVLTYGVAVCKEGPRCAILLSLLQERWKVSYPGLQLSNYRARRASSPARKY